MRKCTNVFTIYEGSLVKYDFAPDPSEFPNIWGKFSFLFYQCSSLFSVHSSTRTKVHNPEVQSTGSAEQELRLHGKISSCYTLGLYLRTLGSRRHNFGTGKYMQAGGYGRLGMQTPSYCVHDSQSCECMNGNAQVACNNSQSSSTYENGPSLLPRYFCCVFADLEGSEFSFQNFQLFLYLTYINSKRNWWLR
jgi:hypothetical protein